MTMYQRMSRVLAGIVFVVGTMAVVGCAENASGTKQDGQSVKACKKCPGGSAKACGKKGCDKKGKKCGANCQKPCCKKAGGKKCPPNCQKPGCKKAGAKKCGPNCQKPCSKKT